MESEILKQHLKKFGSLPTLRDKIKIKPATEVEMPTQKEEEIATTRNSENKKINVTLISTVCLN
jgi:hypothetical protein